MLMFATMRQKRTLLLVILFVSLALGGGYVALFSGSTSGIGLPAHALISVFSPATTDQRNADSNQYRITENFDLKYTVAHTNPLVGLGFGKPYLQPIPLTTVFPDIAAADTLLRVRAAQQHLLGMDAAGSRRLPGFLVLDRLNHCARQPHCSPTTRPLLANDCDLRRLYDDIMEIVVAFADYQLFFFRNVIYIGVLAGVLMKLPELDKDRTET